jgi:uncharacterized protein YjbI with pentapeptide repeats
MANDEHVALLKQGAAAWNTWSDANPHIRRDLRGADLTGADLDGADLRHADLDGAYLISTDLNAARLGRADLSGADLTGVRLSGADLSMADLSGAYLSRAYLTGADLIATKLVGPDLSRADLAGARLVGADLSRADLSGANLQNANLVNTDLTGADLTGCRIYGVSAWDLKLERTKQQDLIITRKNEPTITVDNIEVAQFVYLLLHNQKIRDVIDTITSKAVLILGRFTDERKAVLDTLREELRKRNYLPILFDSSVPATRDTTETVSLLARMARFVVADITDAKSIPQELAVIVPDLPSVPVQPLLLEGSAEYSMFEHFKRYPWVLETYRYPSSERLIADLGERVIGPAENYARSVREATPQMGTRQTGPGRGGEAGGGGRLVGLKQDMLDEDAHDDRSRAARARQ